MSSEQPTSVCPVPHHARANHEPSVGGLAPPTKSFMELAGASGGGVCPVNHQAKSAASTTPDRRCSSDGLERVSSSSPTPSSNSASPHHQFPAPGFDQGFKGDVAQQDPNWHYIYSTSIPSTEDRGNSNDGKWWVGPSAHQLMRALQRKGKDNGVTTGDARMVAAIHSVVTETTWAEIMEYEQLHKDSCPLPTLSKFEGKWDQLSPKAQFLHWLGYDKPFDRHDWYVNRCGREVRYIIDYYGATGQHGFHIDARPDLSSVGGLVDRVRVASAKLWARLFPPAASPSTPPSSSSSSSSSFSSAATATTSLGTASSSSSASCPQPAPRASTAAFRAPPEVAHPASVPKVELMTSSQSK